MKDYIWFASFKLYWVLVHPKNSILFAVRRFVQQFFSGRPQTPLQQGCTTHDVPKKIWIYWAQGWESAPPLVKLCRDSWVAHNSDWEIMLLTEKNVHEYVSIDDYFETKEIPQVWRADILRLYLLEKYGGVWADATTFCTSPLDSWLPTVMQSGFFAYDKPKTTLASWFMVSEEDNYLIGKWRKNADRYWNIVKEGKRYWIFFTFEFLILLDKKAKDQWYATTYISSVNTYLAQNLLKGAVIDEDACIQALSNTTTMVSKLDWRVDLPESLIKKLRSTFPL